MKKIVFVFVLLIFLVSCQMNAVDTKPVQKEQKQQPAAVAPEPADTGNNGSVPDNVDADITSVDNMGDDLGVLNDDEDIDLNLSSFDDW